MCGEPIPPPDQETYLQDHNAGLLLFFYGSSVNFVEELRFGVTGRQNVHLSRGGARHGAPWGGEHRGEESDAMSFSSVTLPLVSSTEKKPSSLPKSREYLIFPLSPASASAAFTC
ncbi:hypothetical protein EYF80_029300 [Liparis tanakae]|uniref:Uncharacterized protein n=1 Tax=Liparis tanakae TaxID=230148 RepID=A0A4Z2H3W8_9TELE|nr:hypothetical protein EYF80_029300 [Liparis tanakae]